MGTKRETPEHGSWRGMIERCENPSHVGFKYYGERGIKVCARWRADFSAFLSDMGTKPTKRHTIDRISSDGDYEPGNCRWATYAEQRRNQRPYDEGSRVRSAWETRSRKAQGRVDIVGQRFGRLVVVRYVDTVGNRARWLCDCDCGADAIITGKNLRNGSTRSCGCLTRELSSQRAVARNREHAADYANSRWGTA